MALFPVSMSHTAMADESHPVTTWSKHTHTYIHTGEHYGLIARLIKYHAGDLVSTSVGEYYGLVACLYAPHRYG